MAGKRTETLAQLLDRLAPGESWEAFAKRAGVSSRTVQRLRDGVGSRPFRTTVSALAKALGCTTDDVTAAIAASSAAAK